MGIYIFITERDRITMRSVTDKHINEEFQVALSVCPSLMIEEYTLKHKRNLFQLLFSKPVFGLKKTF